MLYTRTLDDKTQVVIMTEEQVELQNMFYPNSCKEFKFNEEGLTLLYGVQKGYPIDLRMVQRNDRYPLL